MTEEDYLELIDKAIVDASFKMDLMDVADASEVEQEDIYEARFHCGTCMTNTVMETVWPSIQSYIDFLKQEKSNV